MGFMAPSAPKAPSLPPIIREDTGAPEADAAAEAERRRLDKLKLASNVATSRKGVLDDSNVTRSGLLGS